MKININALILCFLTGMVLGSCKKGLLDKSPLNSLSDATVWNDPALVQSFVNDQYRGLPSFDWYDKVRCISLSSACDESIHQYGYDGIYDMNKGALAPSNMTGFDTWSFDYGYIRKIDVFFSKINQVPGEAALLDRMKGEMHFLRAWYYLELAERYGGVPLITEPFQLDDEFKVPRSSYDSTVDFIVAESDSAAALLPESYGAADLGRATQGAAMALKSRILLYAASPLWNPSNDPAKWQKAATAAKAVIDMTGYHLYTGPMGTYGQIFTDNTNEEIIFQRTIDPTSANTVYSAVEQTEGPDGGINALGQYGGWNTNSPSENLVDAFGMKDGLPIGQSGLYNSQDPYTNRDPRFYADINYDGAKWWADSTLEFFVGGRNSPQYLGNSDHGNSSRTGYTMRKHLNLTFDYQNDHYGQTTDPWIIFRISEMYLNYAEAEYGLGIEEQARWALDQLRSRPSVNLPAVTESGNALLLRIQNERQVELCFEAQRFWDVRRWKIADVTENTPLRGINIVLNANGTKTYTVKDVQDRVFHAPQQFLFPIPDYELQKVQLQQNPGY
jgi:hypothetical protein